MWSKVNPTFDPRAWLPGSTYSIASAFQLSKDFKPGSYELRMALVDESEIPKVRLGNEGVDAQLRYRLGEVVIQNAN